jgi:hypothetical protein
MMALQPGPAGANRHHGDPLPTAIAVDSAGGLMRPSGAALAAAADRGMAGYLDRSEYVSGSGQRHSLLSLPAGNE